MTEKAWKEFRSTLVPVRVVDAKNNIVGTHLLPKESLAAMQGQKGMWAGYVDGGKYFNVSMKERHHVDKFNAELAAAARNVESGYKAKVAPQASKAYAQAQSEIGKAQGMLNAKSGELAIAGGEIGGNRAMYGERQRQRDEMWAQVRGDQAKRIETMRQIFSGFSVGGAKK
jgi:hypothetical protein